MNRLTISLLMLATSAFAADDLASLAGFESAFRRALEARDVDQLDRLTCWDGVSAQDRTRWHDIYFTTTRRAAALRARARGSSSCSR